MKLLIAGGTGFVGQGLINALKKTHDITVLTRTPNKALTLFDNIATTDWQGDNLKETIENMDVVINLVGENIGNKRWSSSIKSKIINSRTKATQTLCDIIKSINKEKRPRFFNASAIGIYGLQTTLTKQNEVIYSEESQLPNPPTDFLSKVGQAWELPLNAAPELDSVTLRFSVVLHPSGGMLKKVSLPFMLGLGGRVGSGRQPFSWIALEDVIGIITYLLDNPDISGTFNLVAPTLMNQKQFARSFAHSLNRPSIVPLPSFIVKLLFGQMGEELLLTGQSVSSKRLTTYEFKYPTLEKALTDWYK